MIPVKCRVKHDAENGTYGDCVRACVASIMNMDAEQVPHFYHDNCDGMTGYARIRQWLASHGCVPFWVNFPGEIPLPDLFALMETLNPTVHYVLHGGTGHGDHAVVCQGGKVVNNPAWFGSSIIQPGSHGLWSILTVCVA